MAASAVSGLMSSSLGTMAMIFGGCCSNVFALEAIIKSEPDSGLLITFYQFLFAALVAYPTQIANISSPTSLVTPKTPLRTWTLIASMFFSINMLNNWAFAFNISVPVHIILRSFGSVSTMAAGYLRGKRYTPIQVASVVLLTIGVLISARADAEAKGKLDSSSTSLEVSGLAILLLAQLLSAFMGNFVQDTYAEHAADWRENLFYTHFLSLPLFLPLGSTLSRQAGRLNATEAMSLLALRMPRGQIYLFVNALTQLACITGVNILSSRSSAVTVTIVLNVRKLVSFVFSTWLFGHALGAKMALGAAVVFGSGALYSWESSWRIPRQKRDGAKASAFKAKRERSMKGHSSG